jgi:hypothetical protein
MHAHQRRSSGHCQGRRVYNLTAAARRTQKRKETRCAVRRCALKCARGHMLFKGAAAGIVKGVEGTGSPRRKEGHAMRRTQAVRGCARAVIRSEHASLMMQTVQSESGACTGTRFSTRGMRRLSRERSLQVMRILLQSSGARMALRAGCFSTTFTACHGGRKIQVQLEKKKLELKFFAVLLR